MTNEFDKITEAEMAAYLPHYDGDMLIEPKPEGEAGRWFEQFNIQGGRESSTWEFDSEGWEWPCWISRVEFDENRSRPLMAQAVIF